MPRGPHDDEIHENDPDKDHARQRLDELLKKREPDSPPADPQDEDEGADAPQDPGRSQKPSRKP